MYAFRNFLGDAISREPSSLSSLVWFFTCLPIVLISRSESVNKKLQPPDQQPARSLAKIVTPHKLQVYILYKGYRDLNPRFESPTPSHVDARVLIYQELTSFKSIAERPSQQKEDFPNISENLRTLESEAFGTRRSRAKVWINDDICDLVGK
ncbi:hypothetical protein BDZ97DRAFT_1753124 [Flammula alnicola]|nr:hypothetical protein BDZ97DRAFT_1753124 [Flammula alnicola]